MERKAARVKNRVRPTTMYPTLAGYGLVVIGLYSVMDRGGWIAAAALATVLYLGASMLAAWMIYQHELGKLWIAPNEFKRHLPFHSYGSVARAFQHVFHSDSKDVLLDLQRGIKGELVRRGLAKNFRVAQLTDADAELTAEDARHFCLATASSSPKNTVVTIAIHPRAEGGTQCISWWVMVAGFVDQDRVFRFVSQAPLRLPFWILGYLRSEVDVIERVRNTYSGFYRDLDLNMTVRAIDDAMRSGLTTTMSLLGLEVPELTPASVRPGLVSESLGAQVEDSGVGRLVPASVSRALGQSATTPLPGSLVSGSLVSGSLASGSAVSGSPRPGSVPPGTVPPLAKTLGSAGNGLAGNDDDDEVTRPMGYPIPQQLAGQKPRLSSAVYKKKNQAA